jgi:hypothetical protein
MKKEEIIAQCDKQMNIMGPEAQVGFVLSGKWGKKDTKRLYPSGPIGKIVNEFEDGSRYGYNGTAVYVFFSAKEVKNAVSLLDV